MKCTLEKEENPSPLMPLHVAMNRICLAKKTFLPSDSPQAGLTKGEDSALKFAREPGTEISRKTRDNRGPPIFSLCPNFRISFTPAPDFLAMVKYRVKAFEIERL